MSLFRKKIIYVLFLLFSFISCKNTRIYFSLSDNTDVNTTIYNTSRLPYPIMRNRVETNIKTPSLIPFYTNVKTNKDMPAILIIPGGPLNKIMIDVEGIDVEKKFNKFGYDCYVLSYRLPYEHIQKDCAFIDVDKSFTI